jgi:hypothetical protein
MQQQMSALSAKERKRLYDRVQELEVEDVPLVFLVSPNVLVGAEIQVHNFEPAASIRIHFGMRSSFFLSAKGSR